MPGETVIAQIARGVYGDGGFGTAILYPSRARDRISVGRGEPDAGLAGLVDYFWWVRWEVPGEPHVQEVIPRPVVHVAVEPVGEGHRVLVHGVRRTRFERRLAGAGRTVAAGFRPAGFRPLLGRDLAELRDREVPAGELFDVDDAALAARVLAEEDDDLAAGVLAAWLRELVPAAGAGPDPLVARLRDLVERVEQDTSLVRAEQLADAAGVGLRTLQRQFLSHVGVGPKWVVARFRLLDVADAANAGEDVDWAGLAARLGYTDQSHLIRAFRTLVGRPPAAYAEEA